MYQRDYIQRLIREFMSAIERMLEKKEVESRRTVLQQLYEQYVGPYAFYQTASLDDVMKSFDGVGDVQTRLAKMEMLAELYYQEAWLVSKPVADELLAKAFLLYDFVERNGSAYSILRRQKMQLIKQKIDNSL